MAQVVTNRKIAQSKNTAEAIAIGMYNTCHRKLIKSGVNIETKFRNVLY